MRGKCFAPSLVTSVSPFCGMNLVKKAVLFQFSFGEKYLLK